MSKENRRASPRSARSGISGMGEMGLDSIGEVEGLHSCCCSRRESRREEYCTMVLNSGRNMS